MKDKIQKLSGPKYIIHAASLSTKSCHTALNSCVQKTRMTIQNGHKGARVSLFLILRIAADSVCETLCYFSVPFKYAYMI
jgi:hypothetical protein